MYHLPAVWRFAVGTEDPGVGIGQDPGILVGLASDHHAVDRIKLVFDLRERLEAAVDHEPVLREIAFECVHHTVLQRWYLAVFLGAESLQPCLARMHDEGGAAGLRHAVDKLAQFLVAVAMVDADAVLDRYRPCRRL